MNESYKIIAEFIDKASPAVKELAQNISEFTKGVVEGAAAELKLMEQNEKLEKSAKKAASPVSELEDRLKKLALQLIAVSVVINGFADAIKEADKLDDLSEKTGLTAGNLRELSYAAKIGGTSLEGLIGAMDKLSRSADKSDEEMSKQAQTFKQLGVEAANADGSLKSSEQLMLDLADAFQGIQDGPEKSAAAFRLFGSEAKNILPLLNKGSEEFKRLKEESRELSGVSEQAFTSFAAASGNLFDNIDKLGQVFSGLFTTLASELVPVFNVVLEEIIASAKEGGMLRDVMKGLGAVFSNVVAPGIKLAAIILNGFFVTLKTVGKGLGAFAAAVAAVFAGDFSGAKKILSEIPDIVAAGGQEISDFQTKMALAGHEAVKLAENVDKPKRKIGSLGTAAKQTKSELEDMVNQMRIANQSFGMDESAKQSLEAQAKFAKDIKAGIEPKRAAALLKEAQALIELNRVLREAADGQKAFEDAQVDIGRIEEQAEIYRYEASLVGKSADERERLIEKFKEEIELRKIVAGLSDDDAAKVSEQYRRAQEARAEAKKAADDAKIANELYDQSITGAQEVYAKRVEILYKMYEEGKITLADYTKLQQEEFDKLTNKMKTTADEATVFWQEAAKNMQGAMSSFFFDFMQGKMSNLGQSFKRMIDQMVANAAAAKLGDMLFGAGFQKNGQLGGLLGSVFSGASNLFGGFRENGGDVQAGKAYVVGEKRPELFVPKVPGMIVPSLDGIGGSSNNLNITVHAFDSKDVLSAMDDISRKGAKMFSRARGKYNF